jgi:hypothetical protein
MRSWRSSRCGGTIGSSRTFSGHQSQTECWRNWRRQPGEALAVSAAIKDGGRAQTLTQHFIVDQAAGGKLRVFFDLFGNATKVSRAPGAEQGVDGAAADRAGPRVAFASKEGIAGVPFEGARDFPVNPSF